MMKLSVLALVALLGWPGTLAAQQSDPGSAATTRPAQELPVSLARIKKKLAQTPPSKQNGLRLQYYVEVYGKPVTLDLFRDFDLKNGPVPYGGPTHTEFLWMVTPQEFRSPAADIGALIQLLLKELGKKK